ncbi:MAG: thiol-disulfide isomerase/thioredoxin [Nitriliruptoraceae bacterium]|jgi:thiol-disulfide isomerase/thioredoxin
MHRLIGSLVLVALLLAACSAQQDQVAASAAEPEVEALWWQATTLNGELLDATDLAGGDVVLWMWAPWCSVCNREAPEVARALADLPDDVTLIGVAGRDEAGAMQDFVAEHGLQAMQHVVDEDGALWASYSISYQPAWVFIAADGEASVAAGAIGYDGLFAGIERVFGDS